jgi:hypothetical protein
MKVCGKVVQFLLDCGATVNLIPKALVCELKLTDKMQPTTAQLRMFDQTELKVCGTITLPLTNLRTGSRSTIDFHVAAYQNQPLLGLQACRSLKLLKLVDENVCTLRTVSQDSVMQDPRCITVDEVLTQYADLFDGIGSMDGEVHFDVDPSVPPVQMPLRRVPFAVRDKVAAELRRLEANGIITPVTEPTRWVSPLLVVAKTGNRIRLCLDPVPLNKALQRVPFCMPTINDVLTQLHNVKVLSTVDFKDAFLHLSLDRQSSLLTTMETPFGRYRWLRMPYGVSPAPEIFSARAHAALSGLKGIASIADDVICFGSGDTEAEAILDHNANLRALLDRCRQKGIKLNKEKLKLNRRSIVFCGHELGRDGVRPDQRKVAAIVDMPPPTDRQGVMRLIGMTTYLSKFCPNFSTVTAPIRALLQKENEFCWRPEVHGVAFSKLKNLLTNAPTLGYFDARKPIVCQSDASQAGLGAVILQDGRPIEYASRAMTRTEQQSYAQIEKELLAILFAMERFDSYVYAHSDVTVETDHKPLIAISKKCLSAAPKRLQRMLLRLQRYNYKLVFRPGSQMVLPDTLSRAYPQVDGSSAPQCTEFPEELAALMDDMQQGELRMVASERTIQLICNAAKTDDEYQMLRSQIAAGWPADAATVPSELRPYMTFADELIVSGELVFKGNRVVIPFGARDEILARIHSSHIGVNGCIRRARESVYFPGITAAIKRLVAECPVCVRFQTEIQKEPLMPHPPPARPWQRVGTDVFTHYGQDYLVTVDYLTNYFEVDRLASKRSADIIYVLKQQWARHGIPEEVVSDNAFCSAEFATFARMWEFKHTTSSPRYPQSNGRAEAAVKTAKRLMSKAKEAGADPFLALLDWRNTPAEHSGLSPAQLMFGRRTRTRLPTADTLLTTPASAAARASLCASKERQASYYMTVVRKNGLRCLSDKQCEPVSTMLIGGKGRLLECFPAVLTKCVLTMAQCAGEHRDTFVSRLSRRLSLRLKSATMNRP